MLDHHIIFMDVQLQKYSYTSMRLIFLVTNFILPAMHFAPIHTK